MVRLEVLLAVQKQIEQLQTDEAEKAAWLQTTDTIATPDRFDAFAADLFGAGYKIGLSILTERLTVMVEEIPDGA